MMFKGVEFTANSGYSVGQPFMSARWTAYLGGVRVGSGTGSGITQGAVLGFSDGIGFDELQFDDEGNATQLGNAPAIDNLRATLATVVAGPGSATLMFAGLALVFAAVTRRRPLPVS